MPTPPDRSNALHQSANRTVQGIIDSSGPTEITPSLVDRAGRRLSPSQDKERPVARSLGISLTARGLFVLIHPSSRAVSTRNSSSADTTQGFAQVFRSVLLACYASLGSFRKHVPYTIDVRNQPARFKEYPGIGVGIWPLVELHSAEPVVRVHLRAAVLPVPIPVRCQVDCATSPGVSSSASAAYGNSLTKSSSLSARPLSEHLSIRTLSPCQAPRDHIQPESERRSITTGQSSIT